MLKVRAVEEKRKEADYTKESNKVLAIIPLYCGHITRIYRERWPNESYVIFIRKICLIKLLKPMLKKTEQHLHAKAIM